MIASSLLHDSGLEPPLSSIAAHIREDQATSPIINNSVDLVLSVAN
jgi:hypothetical protein